MWRRLAKYFGNTHFSEKGISSRNAENCIVIQCSHCSENQNSMCEENENRILNMSKLLLARHAYPGGLLHSSVVQVHKVFDEKIQNPSSISVVQDSVVSQSEPVSLF